MAPVLDEVVSEHGADVSIAAVNRIRTGGVAGFFCREEYEVLVEAPAEDEDPVLGSDDRRRPRRATRGGMVDLRVGDDEPEFRNLLEEHLRDTEETAHLRGARDQAARGRRGRRGRPAAPPAPQPVPPAVADAMAEVGEPVVDLDPEPITPTFVEPTPAAEHILDDDAPTAGAPTAPIEAEPTTTVVVEAPEGIDGEPDAGIEAEPTVAPEPVPVISVPKRGPRSTSFWMRLYRLRRELDTYLPPTNDVTAVVGPLVHTMPVIRNLQCEAGLPAESVIVLTPRAEVVSEPSWCLVRSGQQMLEAIDDRRDQPAVLAIDVDIELPVWVEPLLTRLRHHGLGVTRYLLGDVDQIEILLHHRGASNGAFMIDISRPLQPEDLVELIDRRLPIATVAGVSLNAELLLAMRSQRLEGTRLDDG
ncbi:MAG: hypothetical protein AAF962_20620 [Actinomycetota bacterium]